VTKPQHVSRARRLGGDAIIVFSLLNERRHRIMPAVFGVAREYSNLVTLFAIAAFVRALRRAAAAPRTQVRRIRSSPTRVGDTMVGTAAAKETIDSIAGHPSRDISTAAALIGFAVVVHSFLPAVERSLRAMWEAYRGPIAEARKVGGAIRRFGI
jgi:hypothetical protein